MNDDQYSTISKKLDRLITLLAASLAKGLDQEEQVRLLSSAGFQPIEIAPIIGKTPNAVSITLHRLRKKERGEGPIDSHPQDQQDPT